MNITEKIDQLVVEFDVMRTSRGAKELLSSRTGKMIKKLEEIQHLQIYIENHPTRSKLYSVTRSYVTEITYKVWGADESDALDAVNNEDWHTEDEEYIGSSEKHEDVVREL